MPKTWLFGGQLLQLAQQVWRDECSGGQADEGTGVRDHAIEEASGRVPARRRGHEESVAKKVVTAPARRELVRFMIGKGLSERRSLRVIRMSPSSFRYEAAPDRNRPLREKIVALAQRHRRYGSGMIYLKLRQAGEKVNHKRISCVVSAVILK